MELTEEKIFSAFGLTRQEEPGNPNTDQENNTGAAGEQEGSRGQEPSGVETTTDNQEEPGACTEEIGDEDEDGAEETHLTEGTRPQSKEERRANAARRRQQEQQEAINAAVQQALQQQAQENANAMAAFFQSAGLTNPFTQKPITNMEEFNEWRQAQDEARLEQELKSGKLTRETLAAVIGSALEQTPAMQQFRQTAQQQSQEEAARKQAFERDVENQLAEIRKSDPSIQRLTDLLDKPYSKEFYSAVKRGNNFLDAYYLATRQQANAQAAASAQQRAMNSMRSKEHMRRTSMGNKPGATITPEEERMYRLFNPGASSEEIQKFQNKVKKG